MCGHVPLVSLRCVSDLCGHRAHLTGTKRNASTLQRGSPTGRDDAAGSIAVAIAKALMARRLASRLDDDDWDDEDDGEGDPHSSPVLRAAGTSP